MELTLSIGDISIIFAYFITLILVGIWFFFRKTSAEAFIDGGRSFSSWVLGTSIFATWMSNIAIISLPALVYTQNWSYFVMFLGLPISALVVIKVMIPLYRRENSISAYTYIERRFGLWAAVYCSLFYAITNFIRLGFIVYLVAVFMGYLTGYEEGWIVLLIGSVVVLYSVLGGLQGIIWTDFMQAILAVVGVLMILGVLVYQYSGGFQDAMNYAWDKGKFNMGSLDVSLLKPTVWLLALHSLISNFQGLGTEQGFVQRYIAAKDEKSAKKAVMIGAVLTLAFAGLLFLLGALLYSFNNTKGLVLESEYVVLDFVANNIPMGLKGLVIVGILSAAMSSIDTEINAISTLFYKHIYQKVFSETLSNNQSLRILHITSFVTGVIPILLAGGMTLKANFLDAWDTFDSIFSGGILGLFLLALLVKRSGAISAMVGIVLSGLLVFWLVLSPEWTGPVLGYLKNPLHFYANLILAVSALVITGYGVSRLRISKTFSKRL